MIRGEHIMNLVSVSQMIDLEKEAHQTGFGYDQMMMNAGSALAEEIQKRYASEKPKQILGLIGSGNNGGDTLIAISKLIEKGWAAAAYLVTEREPNDALVSSLVEIKCNIIKKEEDISFEKLRKLIEWTDLILDGILGTGIKLPLRESITKVLQVISGMEDLPEIIAVDCPSGVDCDTGEAAETTLHASLTVCMSAVKQGLLKFPAFNYVGEITTVDIGLPENLSGYSKLNSVVVDQKMVNKMLPRRPLDAHKGTFGTCMIVGGSINYCGAVILSARSAYRIGTGLVRAAIPGSIYDAIAGQVPECTWVVLPDSMGVINSSASAILQENLERVDAMLIGPGIGQDKETLDFLKDVLRFKERSSVKSMLGFSHEPQKKETTQLFTQPALVFDADALKLISHIEKWYQLPEKTAVLTPHPGEMAFLTGLTIEEIQKDREAVAREFAQKWGHVVVLKGAVTIVAAPDGQIFYIPIATAALASAGTGDVLAGMITGLLAQGATATDASVAGAWLHAQAGVAAEKRFGQNFSITAGDVIKHIPMVLK